MTETKFDHVPSDLEANMCPTFLCQPEAFPCRNYVFPAIDHAILGLG